MQEREPTKNKFSSEESDKLENKINVREWLRSSKEVNSNPNNRKIIRSKVVISTSTSRTRNKDLDLIIWPENSIRKYPNFEKTDTLSLYYFYYSF